LNVLTAKAKPKDHDALLSYLEPDLGVMLVRYTRNATHRGEFATRFGVNGEKLEKLFEQARAEGATEEQIRFTMDSINALHGMHGLRTKQAINDFVQGVEWLPDSAKDFLTDNSPGVTHKHFRALGGALLTYQNMRILTTSAFSSAIDPWTLALRTNSARIAFKANYQALSDAFSKFSDQEAEQWLHFLGTLNRAMAREDIQFTNYAHDMSPWLKRLNDGFFKINGVEMITQYSRRVATYGASMFLLKHAALPEARSQEYLDYVHVYASDIQRDANGRVKVLTPEEYNRASPSERASDERVRRAIHMIVDQSTLRPGPDNRPLIFNDQHLSAVTHLKGFAIAFHETINKKVWNETFEEGNIKPLLYFIGPLAVIMMASDWLRDRLKYGEEVPRYKQDWDWFDHYWHSLERVGLWGRDELWMESFGRLMNGDVPGSVMELLGPTAEQLDFIARYGVSQREIPTQDLWRHWD
jgi:hypothetical protein